MESYYCVNQRGREIETSSNKSKASRSIKAHSISVYELLVWFLVQDPNFITHYLWNAICIFCLRNVTPWMARKIVDEDIVHFCLNTSAIIFLKKVTGSVYVLDMKNFGWHCRPGSFNNSFSLYVDIDKRKVISFLMNDERIENSTEIFAILLMNFADCLHPKIHSFQNSLYESMKDAPSKYWRMYIHGNYLNESAHSYVPHPWLGFNGNKDWFEHILFIHAQHEIPAHSLSWDRDLIAVSPFLRFAIKSRSIIFQELKRAGLHKIDAEAYFLCSVIHSIDHFQLGKYVEWVDFPDNMKYCSRFNYVCRNFFPHSQYWFLPNNYFCSHWTENELYKRIYHRMKEADPMYADVISISLCF